jgi:hypothetical protein
VILAFISCSTKLLATFSGSSVRWAEEDAEFDQNDASDSPNGLLVVSSRINERVSLANDNGASKTPPQYSMLYGTGHSAGAYSRGVATYAPCGFHADPNLSTPINSYMN